MICEIEIITQKNQEFIDITDRVKACVSKQKINEGVCFLSVLHTTAGLMINENADPDVLEDMEDFFSETCLKKSSYKHAEGNSDAHIKSSLVGCSLNLIIKDGSLFLGTWQGIYFCEFDGPRTRKVIVKCFGE